MARVLVFLWDGKWGQPGTLEAKTWVYPQHYVSSSVNLMVDFGHKVVAPGGSSSKPAARATPKMTTMMTVGIYYVLATIFSLIFVFSYGGRKLSLSF